jgi:uncharacterized protein (DUF433 family)
MNEWRNRVVHDPNVCHGKAIIKGTRVMISVILANLADGASREEIVEAYPRITNPDIDAALHYAATIANDSILPLDHDSHEVQA